MRTAGAHERDTAMASRTPRTAVARKLAAGALSVALAASLSSFTPATAWAVDVQTAQNSLDAAEQQMAQIVSEHQQLEGEIADSQQQIDAATEQTMEAQQAMLDGREVVGHMMVREYTTDSLGEMITLIFSAENFNEFLRRLDYANAVMSAAAEEVQEQKERKAAFEGALEDLNEQRDEQQGRLDELEAKKQEAQRVVDEASASLDNAQAEEAARLQALAEQAAQLQQQEQQAAQPSAGWNTDSREDAAQTEQAPAAESAPEAAPSTPSAPSNDAGSGGADVSSGWLSGTASAYGGSSDPNTPNPGTTATGAVCDDNSMGVAIPMSMPNYASYLGRSVEISYNGVTVVATVNDCGYMGGGSRALDLQPGVFKALGFSTCQDWGVRTVSYRFL